MTGGFEWCQGKEGREKCWANFCDMGGILSWVVFALRSLCEMDCVAILTSRREDI